MKKVLTKINLYLCIISILLCSIMPSNVFGTDSQFYSSNDILYYDPDACKNSSGGGELIGNDNAEKILRFLVGKDLTLIQAAGIIGNWYEESGLDPTALQFGSNVTDANYRPESGNGFGLAQWTYYTRQDKMFAYHQETGRSMIDLSFQLDWFWKEFTEDYAGGVVTLKEKTTISDAAVDFHSSYEGSADTASMIQERVDSGTKLYEQYKSVIADNSGSTTSGSSATCNAESGKATNFIDGFAIYDQYDTQWADKPYGGSATIGESGCGPSAMAMIITALTGQTVTPYDTATYGAANGTAANDGIDGSNWNIQTIVGEHWGLKSTQLGASVNEINTALQGGALIITSGSGSAPFTSGGHYIVIRAVTAEGKWLVGDSNGSKGAENSKTEWDPDTILNGAAKGNIWAVTK